MILRLNPKKRRRKKNTDRPHHGNHNTTTTTNKNSNHSHKLSLVAQAKLSEFGATCGNAGEWFVSKGVSSSASVYQNQQHPAHRRSKSYTTHSQHEDIKQDNFGILEAADDDSLYIRHKSGPDGVACLPHYRVMVFVKCDEEAAAAAQENFARGSDGRGSSNTTTTRRIPIGISSHGA